MGLENLLRAMPHVLGSESARDREIHLTIAGGGTLRRTLEDLAGELGIEDYVTLVGRVTEEALTRHYQAADLFCMPTRIEPATLPSEGKWVRPAGEPRMDPGTHFVIAFGQFASGWRGTASSPA